MDPAAVERIWAAAEHWYAAGMHPAIQVCLRRDGRVVLDRTLFYPAGGGELHFRIEHAKPTSFEVVDQVSCHHF